MALLRDYQCTQCGNLYDDLFEDEVTSCEECGGDLRASFHNGTPAIKQLLVFKPMTIGGCTIHDEKEMKAFKAKAARRLGKHVGEVYLAPDSEQQRNQDCDEIDHDRQLNLKKNGYDQQDVTERRAEVKAKKQEAHDASQHA